MAQLLVKRAQIQKFLQQKHGSITRAIQSSDPAAITDYNTFVKSKRDLDVASKRVLHQALKKVKAEWWASVNASDINDGLSQAAPALSHIDSDTIFGKTCWMGAESSHHTPTTTTTGRLYETNFCSRGSPNLKNICSESSDHAEEQYRKPISGPAKDRTVRRGRE